MDAPGPGRASGGAGQEHRGCFRAAAVYERRLAEESSDRNTHQCSPLLFPGNLALHAGGGAAESGRRSHEIQRRAAEARGEPLVDINAALYTVQFCTFALTVGAVECELTQPLLQPERTQRRGGAAVNSLVRGS